METGLRPSSFNKLQLNAGVLLVNFTYSSYTTPSALKAAIATALASDANVLGFTEGGGTFKCTPDMREITGDGKRMPVKGSKVIDGWSIKLTGTLKEITKENIKRLLPTATTTTSGNIETTTIAPELKKTDYLPNIIWVGDVSDGGYYLIELKNALNLAGMSLTFKDKGEGNMPFEFEAACDTPNESALPVNIVKFNVPAT